MVVSGFLLKISLALLLSFLFGIERQFSNKSTGFGTFVFVAIGSCALGVTALNISPENPLPLLGAIVTGIGFLGAGALIKTSDKIFGFTTAASIWLFAVTGLIIGVGEYSVALVVYGFVWITIFADRFLEKHGIGPYQRKIIIHTRGVIDKDKILEVFKDKKWKLMGLHIDNSKKKSTMHYLLSIKREDVNSIKEELTKRKWIKSFEID